jgi:hypothetical protein
VAGARVRKATLWEGSVAEEAREDAIVRWRDRVMKGRTRGTWINAAHPSGRQVIWSKSYEINTGKCGNIFATAP